ncbi:hypothetical protein PMAYCL1PPCAC_15624, partial [Pristionchus mayeri]
MTAFILQNLGVHSSAIERAPFLTSSIPSVINPLLTMYFVGPYRRFIERLICRKDMHCKEPRSSMQHDTRIRPVAAMLSLSAPISYPCLVSFTRLHFSHSRLHRNK